MVKHTQTIRRLLPTNYLGVSDHFVELPLKGLTCLSPIMLCKTNDLFLYETQHWAEMSQIQGKFFGAAFFMLPSEGIRNIFHPLKATVHTI